ncbi:MAG: zinc-regulated TonB-dependent outer membrane receptor, partial [Lentisphaeria bacterium]|nr:zinc-regulated TonB-dependent outer membrane receptor [Lentisphaeria bacterium]
YLYGIDWVYKYSANGSHGMGDITLQGEYFYRDSRMKLLNNGHHYENKQDGYYLQALYGIAPRWRVGARWEQLGLVNECEDPHEGSWSAPSSYRVAGVADWKLSEYSMLRFQVARHSYSTEEEREKAWEFTFQLQISLGSHPAHDF